ncbi:MAG: DUF4199 domain-containing protein [Robiginitomaculum sp.]|nr:DUF4199 domain-containing protein [Robiginitomaculum sp.]
MKKIIIIYGVIVGAIVITTMIIGYAMATPDMKTGSVAFGYLTMLVAMSLIFAGIKKYRDKELGGVIKFWPALKVGLGISAVAGLIYVIGWEINLALTDYAFIENYTQGIIEAKKKAGLSGNELETLVASMEKMKTSYGNPLYRMPLTFAEIFPVGILVSLLSAAILRNPKILPARTL